MRGLVLAALIAGTTMGSGAFAQTSVVNGGFEPREVASAEIRLLSVREATPTGASAPLTLANLYRLTGREAQAADLYREVLSHENQLMMTASGQESWSHDLARRGLHRPAMTASR